MAKARSTLKKKAFLDSSVLFTATDSPSGGSSKLFTLAGIELVSSRLVLAEVERNVRKKLQSYHLERFFMLASKLTILKQKPDEKLISRAKRVIVEKDSVILAEAKNTKTNFLITLDRKHFLKPKVKKFLKPQEILTPKELIKKVET